MQIAELGEFGLIDRLTQGLTPTDPTTVKGIGDDCAIICPTQGKRTVVTTDLLMEGIHFDLQYTPLTHLGYKAVSVNLSDIYAMNATPRQITVSLALSRRFTVEQTEELYEGMKLACKQHNVDIVGGDISTSLTGLAISITAIGDAAAEDIATRDGAKEHDLICVTGNLGAAYLGLQLLEREKAVFNQQRASMPHSQSQPDFRPRFEGHEYLLQRQLRPEARADTIRALAEARLHPTSMIDISDGLSSELMHLCTQSHTGCRIYEERIPLDYQTATMAEEFNLNVYTCALNGGEDYELLFTLPLALNEQIESLPDDTIIGHIPRQDQGKLHSTRDGQSFPLKAQGWNHMHSDSPSPPTA